MDLNQHEVDVNPAEARLWHQAEASLQAGHLEHAEATYHQLTQSRDFAPIAFLRLSLIAQRKGSFRAATAAARSAFMARGSEVELLEMIAKRMIRLGDFEAVTVCVEEILRSGHIPVTTAAELAKLTIDIFMPELAIRLIGSAKARGLNTPAVNYLHGVALVHLGDMERAEHQFQQAILHDPSLAQAHWMLSKLKRSTVEDNHVRRMEELLKKAEGQDAVLLGYALFKAYDDMGQTDRAWAFLERAMATRRAMIGHDGERERNTFRILEEGRWLAKDAPSEPGTTPIFIVGLPRSGTTLLETVLGRHADVAAAGELHDAVIQLRWACDSFGGFQVDERLIESSLSADMGQYGNRYLESTRWMTKGRRFFTDKMPANFMLVGLLAEAIPAARFLHISRDPIDACFSNMKELFASPYAYSYDQEDMANHYLRYSELMKNWELRYPERILDVRYETLVSDPEGVVRKVMDFCGIPWEEGILDRERRTAVAATASAVQVRDAIHDRYVGHSKRYQAYLQPLIRCLQSQSIDIVE